MPDPSNTTFPRTLTLGLERCLLGGTFRKMAHRLRDDATAAEAPTSGFAEQHRQWELCSAGYLVAVAYIESVVNDAFLSAEYGELPIRNADTQRKMANSGATSEAGVLRRYNKSLELANVTPFAEGDPTYDNAHLLVKIRNELTHFVSSWQDPNNPEGICKLLRDRRWQPRNPLGAVGRRRADEGALFPNHVLCADGLTWAIKTADALTEEWTRRMGLTSVWWRID